MVELNPYKQDESQQYWGWKHDEEIGSNSQAGMFSRALIFISDHGNLEKGL